MSESGDPLHTLHSITGLKIANNKQDDICLEKGVKLSNK
jgi:hypothetical protein